MNEFFQIFLLGVGILLVAIIVNFIATFLGLETWYSFLQNIRKSGIVDSIKTARWSLAFLFLFYPFLLGLVAYYILKIFK